MWDDKYAGNDYVYGTEPNEYLRHHYHHLPMGRLLCLAEGEGRNAVFLAQQGYDVTAVDASKVGLDKARKLAQQKDVDINIIHADLGHFDLGTGQWDGIVSIFCHLPPKLRQHVHAQIVHALKPGGVFLLEAYTPDQLQHATGGPPVAEMMMTQQLLEEELAGLDFNHLQQLERHIIEGTGHTGKGAVVQLIAKKVNSSP